MTRALPASAIAAAIAAIAAIAATAATGCGSKQRSAPAEVQVPSRRATAGERVLAVAPAGADAVLELDVARLRSNRTVGPLLRALGVAPEVGGNLAAASDLLVFVSYRVGESDAGQLVFAAGPRVTSLDGAHRVAADLVAFGPARLLARLDAAAAGMEPTASSDRALLRARAMAMPAKAQGASLRIAASLGFEARLALARQLQLDAVPVWLSVWVDVADDLAAVALLGTADGDEAQDVAHAVARMRDRAAKTKLLRRLGLAPLLSEARIATKGGEVRVVVVIGPRRLARVVALVIDRLAERPPTSTVTESP